MRFSLFAKCVIFFLVANWRRLEAKCAWSKYKLVLNLSVSVLLLSFTMRSIASCWSENGRWIKIIQLVDNHFILLNLCRRKNESKIWKNLFFRVSKLKQWYSHESVPQSEKIWKSFILIKQFCCMNHTREIPILVAFVIDANE